MRYKLQEQLPLMTALLPKTIHKDFLLKYQLENLALELKQLQKLKKVQLQVEQMFRLQIRKFFMVQPWNMPMSN